VIVLPSLPSLGFSLFLVLLELVVGLELLEKEGRGGLEEGEDRGLTGDGEEGEEGLITVRALGYMLVLFVVGDGVVVEVVVVLVLEAAVGGSLA